MDRIKDASQQEKCLEIKSALTPESRRHNRGVLKSSTLDFLENVTTSVNI